MSETVAQDMSKIAGQGTVESSAEVLPLILAKIEKAVPLDSARHSYPAYFTKFVEAQLKGKSNVLVFHNDLSVTGDFEPKKLAENIAGVVLDGNLSVEGNILNENSSVMLFVSGNVAARNIVNGASYLEVLGDVETSGLLIGDGNDGVIRIAGQVTAEATLYLDQDIYVIKGNKGREIDFNDVTNWHNILIPEVLEYDFPTVTKLLEYKKLGRSVFR